MMIKRIFVLVICLSLLVGCTNNDSGQKDKNQRYFDMLALLQDVQNYNSQPAHFSIAAELSKTDDGYRFYVIIDKPLVAMYNVQIMAIVEGDDYTQTMAANAGIFEDTVYNMIPNQVDTDKGYVKGISISGLTQSNPCFIDVLVRYQKKDLTEVIREYYRYEVAYEESASGD